MPRCHFGSSVASNNERSPLGGRGPAYSIPLFHIARPALWALLYLPENSSRPAIYRHEGWPVKGDRSPWRR